MCYGTDFACRVMQLLASLTVTVCMLGNGDIPAYPSECTVLFTFFKFQRSVIKTTNRKLRLDI